MIKGTTPPVSQRVYSYFYSFQIICHLIYCILIHIINPIPIINEVILVNDTHFIIEINLINHYLKKYKNFKNNIYRETEGILP